MKKNNKKFVLTISGIVIIAVVASIVTVSVGANESFFTNWGRALYTNQEGQNITPLSDSEEYKITILAQASLADKTVFKDDVCYIGEDILITKSELDLAIQYYTLLGVSQEQAKEQAITYIQETNALYVAAIKNGYSVTEEEVREYLESLKEMIASAENQEDVKQVIEAYGSEDAYWEYEFHVYEKNLPIQNYVADLERSYAQEENLVQGSEEFQEKWLEHFQSLKTELVEQQSYVSIDEVDVIPEQFDAE